MNKYGLTAVLLLGVSTTAAADSALDACRRAIFKQADANSDGVLTSTEAASEPMSMPPNFFARWADKNQDGVLDRQEYDDMAVFVRCENCPAVHGCDSH